MNKNRRVDVGFCKVWSIGETSIGIHYDGEGIAIPADEVLDMLQALSTWYLMGRTEEVVIRDE